MSWFTRSSRTTWYEILWHFIIHFIQLVTELLIMLFYMLFHITCYLTFCFICFDVQYILFLLLWHTIYDILYDLYLSRPPPVRSTRAAHLRHSQDIWWVRPLQLHSRLHDEGQRNQAVHVEGVAGAGSRMHRWDRKWPNLWPIWLCSDLVVIMV
jgi:hypothetical protein